MKRTYVIIYQLGSDASEEDLFKYLKSFSAWAKITDNSWAVVSDLKAKEIRDKLLLYNGKGGSVFVIKSGVEAAWRNTRARNLWFKKNL